MSNLIPSMSLHVNPYLYLYVFTLILFLFVRPYVTPWFICIGWRLKDKSNGEQANK